MNRSYFIAEECATGSTCITGETILRFFTTQSNAFTLPAGYSKLQYLVVGGGGSGGRTGTNNNTASGGGGGGEVIEGEITNPQAGNYSVTIGLGAGQPGSGARGLNGQNSVLTFPDASNITAIGGKGGAGSIAGQTATNASATEGSGGGGSFAGLETAGTGTNQGGDGTTATAAGGGGGAGGNGSTATSTSATPDGGGAGVTSTYFGGTYGAGGGAWAVHATVRNAIASGANTGNGSSGNNRTTLNVSGIAASSGVVLIKLIP